jgi:hypothetical protein
MTVSADPLIGQPAVLHDPILYLLRVDAHEVGGALGVGATIPKRGVEVEEPPVGRTDIGIAEYESAGGITPAVHNNVGALEFGVPDERLAALV